MSISVTAKECPVSTSSRLALGCLIDLFDGQLFHGETAFTPAVATFGQRTHPRDPSTTQTQGHLRGGGFVGAVAEEDEFAVARNDFDGFLQVRRAHVHSAGDRFRLCVKFERVAEVNHDNIITRVEALLQFLGSDARNPQVPQKSPPVLPFPNNVAAQGNAQKTNTAASDN